MSIWNGNPTLQVGSICIKTPDGFRLCNEEDLQIRGYERSAEYLPVNSVIPELQSVKIHFRLLDHKNKIKAIKFIRQLIHTYLDMYPAEKDPDFDIGGLKNCKNAIEGKIDMCIPFAVYQALQIPEGALVEYLKTKHWSSWYDEHYRKPMFTMRVVGSTTTLEDLQSLKQQLQDLLSQTVIKIADAIYSV